MALLELDHLNLPLTRPVEALQLQWPHDSGAVEGQDREGDLILSSVTRSLHHDGQLCYWLTGKRLSYCAVRSHRHASIRPRAYLTTRIGNLPRRTCDDMRTLNVSVSGQQDGVLQRVSCLVRCCVDAVPL